MRERKVGQDVRMSGRVLVGGLTETPKRHPEWAQETCGDGESFRLTTIAADGRLPSAKDTQKSKRKDKPWFKGTS